MKDVLYSYDRDVYTRAFMNCYQRQAMVMLAEAGYDVRHLFAACLVSTDDVLEQIVRRRTPKYDFTSGFFRPDALRRLGILHEDVPFDTFADARATALEAVDAAGFALLVVDVFYLPHCPEYRNEHLVHAITLKEYEAASDTWSIVDENPASVLCSYSYPEQVIAAAFDNNTVRRLRTFTAAEPLDAADLTRLSRQDLADAVAAHTDSLALFGAVEEVLTCRWLPQDGAVSALHDALSIYQGSRAALRHYLAAVPHEPAVDDLLARLVEKTIEVQNMLLLGKVTGMVDVAWLAAACAELCQDEKALVAHLHG